MELLALVLVHVPILLRCILLMMLLVILMGMYGLFPTVIESWSSGRFQPMEIGHVKEPTHIQEVTIQWVLT